MTESTAHIRGEIDRLLFVLKRDTRERDHGLPRSVELGIEIADRKVDVALWAIGALLKLLDERDAATTFNVHGNTVGKNESQLEKK